MVLKVKKCPKSGYWISVLRITSCTMKVLFSSLLVRRDFGIQDILCQIRIWIHWKVDNLFTAMVLKVKMCPKSGYWISVLRIKSCTMKVSFSSLLVRRDFGIQDIMCHIRIWIHWKVDNLFTAMVLKVIKSPKSGYWISVLRFKSCTMKVSFSSLLVRRDFGIQDIMCHIRIWIQWKVDNLFTAMVLNVIKCPKSGYWFPVLRFKSCIMKVWFWYLQVRRDFGT